MRRVREAAAGLLPTRLDAAGSAAAVELLDQTATVPAATAASRTKTTPQPAAAQHFSAPGALPWPDGDALARLTPGTVTGWCH
ncbi:hypothetical protein ACF05L_39255 [Streptomyces bobili]|uniref:hypothetical protein n=1 Tax=Streptomyces bobili TaxID=67280 RepID=UPI0036FB5695